MIPRFSRKETIVLLVLVGVMMGVNLVNYIGRRRMEKSLALVIEEGQMPVSLNEASSGDLEGLPGIGPALAERIVAYRNAAGGYQRLDELKKVRGVGDKLFQKILPFIKL
jgi:competence ComEA-like helix-hairpin-helix protein